MNFQALQIHFRIHADLLTQKKIMIPIICYLALILVSMAIATVVYTLVILGWCGSSFGEELGRLSHIWLTHSSIQKGIEKAEAALLESESCVVCACQVSKMGENVRQLPNCKHFFSFSLY